MTTSANHTWIDRALRLLSRHCADESGATAVEYGVIIAVMSSVLVLGIGNAGNGIGAGWSNFSNTVANAIQ